MVKYTLSFVPQNDNEDFDILQLSRDLGSLCGKSKISFSQNDYQTIETEQPIPDNFLYSLNKCPGVAIAKVE